MTHDDPKLTAYALNELDAADRAQVEAMLEQDPAARQFVEDTRRTIAMLTQSLKQVETPTLTMEQRETVQLAAAGPAKLSYAIPIRTGRKTWTRWALATAACAALVGGGLGILYSQRTLPNQNVAINPLNRRQTEMTDLKGTIAMLKERSQQQILKRNYKQAMGILDQILMLDPSDEYARREHPLVSENYRQQAQSSTRPNRERFDREFTNQMNSAPEFTERYENILRYPYNLPDISVQPNTASASALAWDNQRLPITFQGIGGGGGNGSTGPIPPPPATVISSGSVDFFGKMTRERDAGTGLQSIDATYNSYNWNQRPRDPADVTRYFAKSNEDAQAGFHFAPTQTTETVNGLLAIDGKTRLNGNIRNEGGLSDPLVQRGVRSGYVNGTEG